MISQEKREAIPRVSVLTTSYNAYPFVRDAIDSVIGQTFTDWELIAVDDGSTDESLSALKQYSDTRVRVFPLAQNVGRIAALRFAFSQARGDYIAINDADDISSQDRLARQVEFLDQNPDVALVGSWAEYIDGRGKVFGELKPTSNREELHDCLGWGNPVPHSSTMYRRKLAAQAGAYQEDIEVSNDYALILAMAQISRIAIIDDFLCQVRVLPTSMMRSEKYQVLFANERLLLLRRAANWLELSAKSRRLNRNAIAIDQIKLGIIILRTNSFWAGAIMILRGLITSPSVLWNNGPVKRLFGVKC
jgi:glycosyltransferase involved in cell wall biosynthesis